MPIIEDCPACAYNAPRNCISHTCIDCGRASFDVESHRCA